MNHPTNPKDSEAELDPILIELLGLEYDSDENGYEGYGLFHVEMETGAKFLAEDYMDERNTAKAKLLAWRDRCVAEAEDAAYDNARRHLYTPSQIHQALGKVLGRKTAPKYVQAITEDVAEELCKLAPAEPTHE